MDEKTHLKEEIVTDEKTYLKEEIVTDEKSLFEKWKNKPVCNVDNITIDHSRGFIEDGIINKNIWKTVNKKILFILKEAYYDKKTNWSLTDYLVEKEHYSAMWRRAAEWTYAINNTNLKKIADPKCTKEFDDNMYRELINQIAVVNIKKSNGEKRSDMKELLIYAKHDKEELRAQIEMIDPDIIVCGYTIEPLDLLYDYKIRKYNTTNYYGAYITKEIGGKERIVLDFYHPANKYPIYMNFYTIAHVYQESLKIKK